MTTWYKEGVRGRLNPQARKCLGRIHNLHQHHNQDLFITSIEEGNHGAGSLHYCGNAFDMRYAEPRLGTNDYIAHAGKDFDVIYEADHIHIEYDPKI